MKTWTANFAFYFLVSILFILNTSASVRYVNLNSPNSTPPYSDWSTAATNIQVAIDASTDGDQILVTNGIYQAGGKVMVGDLANRVALDKAITVQSVNGPWVTLIQGAGATNGTAAVRCAWLTNGAALVGFTLSGGGTRVTGDTTTLQYGGGVWCVSSNAFVGNCLIVSNTANQSAGGAYQGTVSRSLISGNKTGNSSGGATYKSVINNCTIVSNSTYGAVSPFAMTNCIIYYNGLFGNYVASGTAFSHCCTTPALAGTGNFTNAPQLFADGIHLSTSSPCIGTGINSVVGTDIFGYVWSNPPSVGCAEWQPAPIVTAPQIKLTSDPVGFTIGIPAVGGSAPYTFAWIKDGSPLQNIGHFSFTQTTNLVATGVSFADAGNYQVVVSNAFGMVTSAVAQLVFHCVDAVGSNPIAPYSNWATAATNIQDAIAASAAGDVVLVTNGLYASGGKSMDAVITNRVSVDKAILVQSVNGPNLTIIQGARDPIYTNGPGAVRCAWLTNNAILNGFTLRGGATIKATSSPIAAMRGGGVFGTSNTATLFNCVITANTAGSAGAGAYSVTLKFCTVASNYCGGSGAGGSGGGAANCNLNNCIISSNSSDNDAGGAQNCKAFNSLFNKNSAGNSGSGAYQGSLVNCTVTDNRNTSKLYSPNSSGVASALLTNCIIYGNFNLYYAYKGPANYNVNCTFSYSDTDPLPAGVGNIDVDPQLLADGTHLASTSACIGAGTASVVFGTDLDGQPWNIQPAIGCDEWQPAPVISSPLVYQINSPAHGLTFNVIAGGQLPFTFFWSKDGAPIQDDGHYINSGTPNLVVNYFGPADAGIYQVVVSNAFGVASSQVAQVVIHAVDVGGINPIAPYFSWATAATNIQDAINVASAGDIVLVTNGIYALGGKVMAGDLTNRIAVDKAITVMTVNGYAKTAIQGAWDPVSTNGPGAVRCAYLTDGAVLNGFTLQNGATRSTGDPFANGPLESGGGVWCNSASGIVANCLLSNNCAIYGGGIINGTLNNSLVTLNQAALGGGAYAATLNNCTVVNNYTTVPSSSRGAGTYSGTTQNSIVMGNYDAYPLSLEDNYGSSSQAIYAYSCTFPTKSGFGNTNANPRFLDSFHIASTSACFGAGSAAYTSGTDLDGEPWANPPSMGCDEVIVANLVGLLSVNVLADQTNLLVNRLNGLSGIITGRASGVAWSFGDGPTVTNSGAGVLHQWTNSGDYTVTFTAFNNDNPTGVSTNLVIHVEPLTVPQLQSILLLTNGFQFQFIGQTNANYTIQYATNLISPVSWQTLQAIYLSGGGLIQITDSTAPTGTRFYRVLAQ